MEEYYQNICKKMYKTIESENFLKMFFKDS